MPENGVPWASDVLFRDLFVLMRGNNLPRIFDRKLLPLYFNYKFLSSSFDGQNGEKLKLKHFE